MPKFRRIAKVIEAEQFFTGLVPPKGVCTCAVGISNEHIPHVHTIHQGQFVLLSDGDWVLPEPDGVSYYPCKPDVFADTYEPLEPEN
jgi:hypothetical protein